jgi:hypothetical protein
MNVSRVLSVAALCLALLPGAALARRAKVEAVNNPTINIETKATAAQVKKAVKLAVLNRKWNISNEKGNEFDATYDHHFGRSNSSATIHITHSPKTVTIKYVTSEGLDAEGTQISRAYNMWVENLVKDIPIYVEREVVASQ